MIVLGQLPAEPTVTDYQAELVRLQRLEQEAVKRQTAATHNILRWQRIATIVSLSLASVAIGTAYLAWRRTGKFRPPVVVV